MYTAQWILRVLLSKRLIGDPSRASNGDRPAHFSLLLLLQQIPHFDTAELNYTASQDTRIVPKDGFRAVGTKTTLKLEAVLMVSVGVA